MKTYAEGTNPRFRVPMLGEKYATAEKLCVNARSLNPRAGGKPVKSAIWATRLLIAVMMLAVLVGSVSIPARALAGGDIDDSAITRQVNAAVDHMPDLTAPQYVKVRTKGGVVHLFGFVDRHHQISRLTGIAGKVNGVRSIENHLVVIRYAPGYTSWH